jgi:hypothetical protein
MIPTKKNINKVKKIYTSIDFLDLISHDKDDGPTPF